MTALVRTIRNRTWQTRPLVRGLSPHEQTRNWQQQKSGRGPQMGLDNKEGWSTDHLS
jgi:hypothetical protein